jgi:hypothetical protein
MGNGDGGVNGCVDRIFGMSVDNDYSDGNDDNYDDLPDTWDGANPNHNDLRKVG